MRVLDRWGCWLALCLAGCLVEFDDSAARRELDMGSMEAGAAEAGPTAPRADRRLPDAGSPRPDAQRDAQPPPALDAARLPLDGPPDPPPMPDATPAPDQGPGDGPRPDACADWDGDGICDDVDRCPGFDDGVDTDGDGRPDGCDIACPADGPLAQPALPVSHGGATILAVHFPNGRSVRPGSPVELEVEFQIDRCGCNVEEGERPCQRYLMIGLDRPDAPLRCVFGGPACAPVRMAVPTSIPAPDRPGSYELRFGVDGARCRDRWQGMPPPGAFAVICVEPR